MAGATIGSAAINGLGSLVGGLFQNNANKRLMREQMHWSEQMYDKQVQDQYDLIDYVNKYNTPANQRQLLEAAGYNPALLGQSVSSAASSSDHSIPSVPSAPAAAGPLVRRPFAAHTPLALHPLCADGLAVRHAHQYARAHHHAEPEASPLRPAHRHHR